MLRRVVMLCALAYAAPAFADMDYKCLADCKNSGGRTQTCMETCDYNAPKALSKTDAPAGTAHNEFTAPVEAGNTLVLHPPKLGPTPKPDARCVQECVADKLQYSLCEKRCTPQPK